MPKIFETHININPSNKRSADELIFDLKYDLYNSGASNEISTKTKKKYISLQKEV